MCGFLDDEDEPPDRTLEWECGMVPGEEEVEEVVVYSVNRRQTRQRELPRRGS